MNLKEKYGMAFSYGGFRGESRDEVPTVEQLKEDMKILFAMGVRILRTYNTSEYAQAERLLKAIDDLKKENPKFEMYIMLGTWIQCQGAYTPDNNCSIEDEKNNFVEINKAIEFANNYPEIIKIIAVGNETMVNWQPHHVKARIILKWVNHLKDARESGKISENILITSSDNFASWGGEEVYQNKDLEELIKAVDYISLHTYPFHDTYYNSIFWNVQRKEMKLTKIEKIDKAIERSVEYAKSQYQLVVDYLKKLGIKKNIHIGETGWSSVDNVMYSENGTRASDEYKEKKYYEGMRKWAEEEGILCFYFEAFDEKWKDKYNSNGSENHFGLFTLDGKAKYAMWNLVDDGVFEGLTRDGKEIAKTYNGNESTLLEKIIAPLEPNIVGILEINKVNQNRSLGNEVLEDNYFILNGKINLEEKQCNGTYPSEYIKLNVWEGTCNLELSEEIVKIILGTGDWNGCGLEIQSSRVGENLTNFSDGHLCFEMRGDTKSSFNIGFQTGVWRNKERAQVNNYVTFGSDEIYKISEEWKTYSIPLSELKKDGVDLMDVTSLLYLIGENNFNRGSICLKNVYYTQN